MQLVDDVDQGSEPAGPGADGAAEVKFQSAGLEIALKTPCRRVSVHVMLFTSVAVEGTAYAADGKALSTDRTTTGINVPHVLAFRGEAITSVRLIGLAGPGLTFAAVLFKVCAEADDPGERTCETFDGLKPRDRAVARLDYNGFTFTAVDQKTLLSVVDAVDESKGAPRPGRDGVAEIGFPQNGVRIKLPRPCPALEVYVMLFNPQVVKGEAFDAKGNLIATAHSTSVQQVGQVLRFAAKKGIPVASFTLTGGAGEALIYQICCLRRDKTPPKGPGDLEPPKDVVDVTVTGIVGGELQDAWPGRIADEPQGKGCRLISFTPPTASAGPWDGFRIVSPPGKIVMLVSACGVDQRAIDARSDDIAVQQQLLDVVRTAILAEPDERREIVLEPATTYEIIVTWRWQAWQPNNPGDTPPAEPPDAWSDLLVDTWRFATAPDQTVGASPQDGLNEYVFDARDIDRYLIGVEPADGRGVHFTDDPIWVHFDCGHVEQLLDLYERNLVIEVRRTDPPPQETADLLTTAVAPIAVEMEWMDVSQQLAGTGDQRLNAAVLTSPCLPGGGAPFGGASLAVQAELQPDAHYDLTVLGANEDDRPVVRATRFHTSRYASPREFVDALGFKTTTAPYLPDDLLIPDGMGLPGGALVEGDVAFDDALMAIEADTLPLPTRRARSYVLWSFSRADGWLLEGLFVDSLEPMKRERTIVADSGVPNVGTRLELTHALAAGNRLDLFRVNATWTRALLKPESPIALRKNRDLVLRLHFDSSDGPISGSRRLRGVPSIVEREGL